MTTATRTRTARRPRRTPEERAAQRRELMDRLDAFVAGLAGMDPDDAALVAVERLEERYSERNAQLIVMQRPDVTEVRAFGAWKELGRKVKKGESGIAILAPAGRAGDEEPSEEKPEGVRGRQFFKIVYVFDHAQTEPAEQ